jgi:branched-chain amino acid transport system permease protein
MSAPHSGLRKERLDRGIRARSQDICALASWREILYVLGPRIIPLLIIALAIVISDEYWLKVLVSTGVFALLALSWDLLLSTGLVSLGQSLFFAVGGYVAGILNHYYAWPWWLTIPAGTIVGGLVSTLLLVPVLRLRGVYFSMITLIMPLVLLRIIEATKIVGGTTGYSGLSPFPSERLETALILVVCFGGLFFLRILIDSNFGLVLQAVRDNEHSVTSSGIDVYWIKGLSLFVAACTGSFAGAFMTHSYQFVGMPAFALDYSILPMAAVLVGGMGTLTGSLVGAFVLVPLSELLRALGSLRVVFYGLFLVLFILVFPEGIFSFLRRKYTQFEHWVKI